MQSASVPVPVVDAHHHLWRYSAEEYAWIDQEMSLLRRDFTTEDLMREMDACGIDLAVAVQARTSLHETASLLDAARDEPRIAAVVGWLPLQDAETLNKALERFSGERLLAGVRHTVQDEPAGFLEDAAFNEGIAAITRAGLTYDLLLRANQLQEAATFVDRHPQTTFVLDHLAKPRIRTRQLQPWRDHLHELSRRGNVAAKLSGLVTEADWKQWRPEDLEPYIAAALDSFGPGRLLAGSDWPVLTLASEYAQWWTVLRASLAALSRTEQSAILGGNATRLYHLQAEAH